MMAAGLLLRVRNQGGEARVVNMTCGDSKDAFAMRFIRAQGFKEHSNEAINYGIFRQLEERTAHQALGTEERDLLFLGYPDGSLWDLLHAEDPTKPIRSPQTQVNAVPYDFAVSPGAPYCLNSIARDLVGILKDFRPDTVTVPHPNDNHSDHAACFYLVQRALEISGVDADVVCPLDTYAGEFPMVLKPHRKMEPLRTPPSPTFWLEHCLTGTEREAKIRLISCYKSQMAWEHLLDTRPYAGLTSYLYGYVAQNEVFGRVLEARDDPRFRERLNRRIYRTRVAGAVKNVVKDALKDAFRMRSSTRHSQGF